MTPLKALLWDVDGTIAETERDGHRVAFNQAFEMLGVPWRWDEAHYGRLLRITGGRERLMHDMFDRRDAPALSDEREALAAALHQKKNALYAGLVAEGRLPLRPGVAALMDDCLRRGVKLGIATTTSRSNLEALMHSAFGSGWRARFAAVVCGEDVARKKPDPEVYERALALLGIGPLEAIAIEDSPGGVAAARAAEVPVIATPSSYFSDAIIEGAIAIGPGLDRRAGWRPPLDGDPRGQVRLEDIEAWRYRMETVSQYA